jgi:hypothetical protein
MPSGTSAQSSDLRFSLVRRRGPATCSVKLLFRQGPFSPRLCFRHLADRRALRGRGSCDPGRLYRAECAGPRVLNRVCRAECAEPNVKGAAPNLHGRRDFSLLATFPAQEGVIGTAAGLVYPSRPMNSANCSRPACAGKPAAWLAYDYGSRCAWIDDEVGGPADRSSRWPLCERHANNLRVPRGWSCVDRRASTQVAGSLFDAGPEDGDGGPRELEGHSVGAGSSGRDTNYRLSRVSSRIR